MRANSTKVGKEYKTGLCKNMGGTANALYTTDNYKVILHT